MNFSSSPFYYFILCKNTIIINLFVLLNFNPQFKGIGEYDTKRIQLKI